MPFPAVPTLTEQPCAGHGAEDQGSGDKPAEHLCDLVWGFPREWQIGVMIVPMNLPLDTTPTQGCPAQALGHPPGEKADQPRRPDFPDLTRPGLARVSHRAWTWL